MRIFSPCFLIIIFQFILFTNVTGQNKGHDCDSITAIKIAVRKMNRIYGKEHVKLFEPYFAEKQEYNWLVRGTLKAKRGGTPYALIDRYGKIIKLSHGK